MEQIIQIDPGAGPCFGVQRAINLAEKLLEKYGNLRCLDDLIHNYEELKRLENRGLRIVTHCQLVEQKGKKLLLRAHGEPPSTYRIAKKYGVELIDATCPIVKKLQNMVKVHSEQMADQNGQVIVFGDPNHAEINALRGYCKCEFHVVSSLEEVENLTINKPTVFFSQTTKYQSDYHRVIEAFKYRQYMENLFEVSLTFFDSQCEHISRRDLELTDFIKDKDLLIFVGGKNSSNAKYLFNVGKQKVESAYFISNPDELKVKWFKKGLKIGISGATSTPIWLLEETRKRVEELVFQSNA